MLVRTGPLCLTLLLPLLACSPALDWREVGVPEADLVALFPCKPHRTSSDEMGLLQCEAKGTRFVLAWQRTTTPQALRDSLSRAADAAASRIGASLSQVTSSRLPSGAMDWPGSGHYQLRGGGQPVQLLLWARGLTGYRAMVLGARSEELGKPFFDGLRAAP